MGRRRERRKPTKREKIEISKEERVESGGQPASQARGRVSYENLSPMTQKIIDDVAKRQRCAIDEIVEILNDEVGA